MTEDEDIEGKDPAKEDELLIEALERLERRDGEGHESLSQAPKAEPVFIRPEPTSVKKEIVASAGLGLSGGVENAKRELPKPGVSWKTLALGGVLQIGVLAAAGWGLYKFAWPKLSAQPPVETAQTNSTQGVDSTQGLETGGVAPDMPSDSLPEVTAGETVAPETDDPPAEPAPLVPPAPPVGDTLEDKDAVLLLKERVRLTSYADEAISTGSRAALEALTTYTERTETAHLNNAVAAELLRVQKFYASDGRNAGNYRLPMGQLFPNSEFKAETDLGSSELIALLRDGKHDWPVRMRAAWLLGEVEGAEVKGALVDAIREEGSIDVILSCVDSFQALTGYRGAFFDTESLIAWWQSQEKN